MTKIETNLEKLYKQNRIVVWYDPERAFEEELAAIHLPDVSVIIVDNDELAIKHHMLVLEPTQKFLLYMPYVRPFDEDNWLLDIELSQQLFHTDKTSMLLQELELPFHFQSWLKQQTTFFNSKERMNKFRGLAAKTDSVEILNNKLIQVLFGADRHDLDTLLREYVKAFVQDKADATKEMLEKFGLSDYFWETVKTQYGIENNSLNIYDFLLKLFQYSSQALCGDQVLSMARVTLSSWMDLQSFTDTFYAVSSRVANDLQVSTVLADVALEDLLDEDAFEAIEQHIVKDIIKKVADQTFDEAKVKYVINKRRSKYWYGKYAEYYQAIYRAVQLTEMVQQIDFGDLNNLEKGFELYASLYYKVDQYYRQFIYLLRKVGHSSLLQALYQEVEKIYSNRWLLDLSDQWQQCVEKNEGWYFGYKSQFQFFNTIVKPNYITQKKKKVFVIISDAMRFEIGEELHQKINHQNRFESNLDYRVTGLPSYTQLGMAALLPNQCVSLGDGDDIFVDGLSSKGTLARAKILTSRGQIKATTITAEELSSFKVKSDEAKSLVQQHDVVYVYHNIIDKTGDDKITEEKVFDAASNEIEHLIELIKRIGNFDITHIVVTADHGFLYQTEELAESDFADGAITGEIVKSNRRFVIGKELQHNDAVLKYTAEELRIHSDREILIPKGMNRLRRQGSGSRFIHGGAMLQEVVIPVLSIVKKREDTIRKVDIDIINKSNNKITTNIHPVKFYQSEPVTGRTLGRKLKAYFAVESQDGKLLISDVYIHLFDATSKRPEDREVKHDFRFSTTLQKHDQVKLFIEEQIEGSTQWIAYTRYGFSLSLGMSNDFDF